MKLGIERLMKVATWRLPVLNPNPKSRINGDTEKGEKGSKNRILVEEPIMRRFKALRDEFCT